MRGVLQALDPKNNPLVTVGLTTRNRAHLLPHALDSLLNQTYRNIEFIVSDNASSDDTERVARSYAERDKRIRYVRQKVLIDGLNNLAYVLQEARGDYFMWASDDDWWDPRFVEALVSVLEQNPEYGVAMSHFYERRIGGDREEVLLRTHEYTHLSHQELYRMYLRCRKRPIFLFGMYRTNIRKRMTIPHCFNGICLFLAEAALARRAYSVPMPLFTWRNDLRPTQVRHADHPYVKAQKTPFAVTRYVFLIPFRLLTSRVIPLRRKVRIFGPWLGRVWWYKRKMFNELLGALGAF